MKPVKQSAPGKVTLRIVGDCRAAGRLNAQMDEMHARETGALAQ
jgi:hypothetical protein